MQLSVVIPVYNSETILPELGGQLNRALEGLAPSHEIVLVNDCSRDGSWNAIKSLCERHATIRGLNLRRNVGQHNAIMAGLNSASGRVIVLMDDDLQHSPADIGKLVAAIDDGFDVCYAKYRERQHAWWKKAGSAFNGLVARLLLKKPKDLYLSPFKAMSAEVKDEIVRYTGPYPYLDGLILMTTSSITSVEVEHHERQAGTGNYSFAKSIRLWLQMATSFSVLPLRVSGLLGMLLALAGLIFSFVVVTLRLLGDAGVPLGWTSLMTALLVIGGAQLVALSLLGEYLGRTYIRLNNVPQFSIKEALNLSIGSAPGDGGFDGRRQANGR